MENIFRMGILQLDRMSAENVHLKCQNQIGQSFGMLELYHV